MKKLIYVILLLFLIQGSWLQGKPGVRVIVSTVDNQIVTGDLLMVDNDYVMVISESNSKVNIPIPNITRVTYFKRRGSFFSGAAVGVILGGISGIIYTKDLLSGFLVGASIAVPLGLLTGILNRRDSKKKVMVFWGKSPEEKAKKLRKLRKMALVK